MAFAEPAPARIFNTNGSDGNALITSYKDGAIEYKSSLRDNKAKSLPASKIQGIYFYEVEVFTEAIELYDSRKYAEAKVKFLECVEAYEDMQGAPNNYSTLAGFYALECSRRMFDLEGLKEGMALFKKEGLTRETQIQQLELNVFWDTVRRKDWEKVIRLADKWRERQLPVSHRAQLAYCQGLAYENLAKENPALIENALNSYNVVLSADFMASRELVVDAASKALAIYSNDAGVRSAMAAWGKPEENKNSNGYQFLREANALAKFYQQMGLDKVKPFAAEAKAFLEFEVKE